MELYKKYLAERDNAEVFYTDDGFVTYAINPMQQTCYFSEFYVVPGKRNTRTAYFFWSHILQVSQASNCTVIIGSVDVTTRNWQLSEKLMLKVGFEHRNTEGAMKYFWKFI
jgi:hypothetical protein